MPHRAKRQTGRRGTALVEFVMILPLIALILGVVWFFGWSMMNQQHVRVSDRYAAWRRVRGGGVRDLNDTFFDQRAINVDVDRRSGQTRTLHDLVSAAGDRGAMTELLAQELVLRRCPRGSGARVEAEFPTEVGLWKRLEGAIASRHVREGVEWRRDEVRCEPVLRDEFLSELNAAVGNLDAPSSEFGRIIRHLYNTRW